MRAVIQRVSSASVSIDGMVQGTIGTGMVILLGIGQDDDSGDVSKLTAKISKLRIFNDAGQQMNLSSREVDGGYLVISQFTLFADTRKGNRPSFINAARPEKAIPLYEEFKSALTKETGKNIQCGIFGADMKVSLVNDGPVTIIIDTKEP